jgi:hypothetical protein
VTCANDNGGILIELENMAELNAVSDLINAASIPNLPGDRIAWVFILFYILEFESKDRSP